MGRVVLGQMDDCLELESKPEMVAVARMFVRDRLSSWEANEHMHSALVVTSELVTNAVLHARTSIQVRIEVRQSVVRVEVSDENPRVPTMAPCPPEATSGRGLALVAALATSWGIEQRDDGKVVWAELGRSGDDPSEDCVDLSGVDTVEEAFEYLIRSDSDPTQA